MMEKQPLLDIVSHLPALKRYALGLTRHGADADDLVHDTLIRAYERRAAFVEGTNLRHWLFAILHNRFIDDTRSSGVRARHMQRSMESAIHASEPPQEDSLWLQQVRRAVESLPQEQREAIHLVAIEGMSYTQAADVLQIPAGTLMSRLARARKALRSIGDERDEPSSAEPPRSHLKLVGGAGESER